MYFVIVTCEAWTIFSFHSYWYSNMLNTSISFRLFNLVLFFLCWFFNRNIILCYKVNAKVITACDFVEYKDTKCFGLQILLFYVEKKPNIILPYHPVHAKIIVYSHTQLDIHPLMTQTKNFFCRNLLYSLSQERTTTKKKKQFIFYVYCTLFATCRPTPNR